MFVLKWAPAGDQPSRAVAAGLAFQMTTPDCEIPASPGLMGQASPKANWGGKVKSIIAPTLPLPLYSMASLSPDGEGLCACTNRLVSARGIVAASALVKSQCECPVLPGPLVCRLLSLQIEHMTEGFFVVQRHKMP